MELGMIGLGRMGANMVRRLMRAGSRCVVYDRVGRGGAALWRRRRHRRRVARGVRRSARRRRASSA